MALRILLNDTDAGRAEALEKKLFEAGFSDVQRITSEPGLAAAVERIAPDLVIIDMALPDRDV